MPAHIGALQSQTSNVVDYILSNALKNRASDIHLEPQKEKVTIRFRVDGLLYEIEKLDSFSKDEIVSRIKVLAQLDIAEHRFPQDGHFEFEQAGKIFNIRVSILPTIYGEAIVLRIFNRSDIFLTIPELGLEPEQLDIVNRLISSPSGMLLTTGPTGSGKTTLLYSILNSLNTNERNIITLEDPIEFQMAGIRQTQINEGIGLTFTKSLRSVVRQDPDIIMLGEIRDADTAQLSIQAALTGILVLSTFHTFDVPALVTRLMETGFSGSVISQAIKGVISTRLVRKICPNCKVSYKPEAEDLKVLGTNEVATLYKGSGCQTCLNKGYLGRVGIYEVVYFDEELRNAITEKQSASQIIQILKNKKIRNLKSAAISKVSQGLTTIAEVNRVSGTLF